MTTNPPQLFLLADHIKLSLLERQRAISLNLPSGAQDGQISRSLEQLRSGIESLESQIADVQDECVQPPSQSILSSLSLSLTYLSKIDIIPTPPPTHPTQRPLLPIHHLYFLYVPHTTNQQQQQQ